MQVVAHTFRRWMVIHVVIGATAIVAGILVLIFGFHRKAFWLIGGWVIGIGALWLYLALVTWKRNGRGLAIADDGLHYWRSYLLPRHRHIVIPWEDVLGARAIHFETDGGWQKGLVIGLHESANNPAGDILAESAVRSGLKQCAWKNFAVFEDSYWDWQPSVVQAEIERRLQA